jgi:hypothetical protein
VKWFALWVGLSLVLGVMWAAWRWPNHHDDPDDPDLEGLS